MKKIFILFFLALVLTCGIKANATTYCVHYTKWTIGLDGVDVYLMAQCSVNGIWQDPYAIAQIY